MDRIIDLRQQELAYTVISEAEAKQAQREIAQIIGNIETVIKGKHTQVELIILCLLAQGHVLIEDIPGVGKTSLVSALAKTVNCRYKRIQFTPDVMPSDVTGFSVYNQKSGEFEFRPGAAMSNIVLADEINRASAKTQSAMLEVMEERQITADGRTYRLQKPFMVLATQNPIDSLGTYKLPEAQIDRFMIKLSLGYPDFLDELSVVLSGQKAKADISSVVAEAQIQQLIDQCEHVCVERIVAAYIVRIVEATRTHADIRLGASPRGSIALYALSRAYALAQGRNFVLPDDVKLLAPYVLSHRLILTHAAQTEKKDPSALIRDIVSQVVVPTNPEQQA